MSMHHAESSPGQDTEAALAGQARAGRSNHVNRLVACHGGFWQAVHRRCRVAIQPRRCRGAGLAGGTPQVPSK